MTARTMSRILLVLATVLCALAPSPLQAQPASTEKLTAAEVAATRELGKKAVSLFNSGKYRDSLDHWARVEKLVGVKPTTSLWKARCYEKLGKLVEASESYRKATRQKLDKPMPIHIKASEQAHSERTALLPRVPKVTLQIKASEGLEVTLDGKPLKTALLGIPMPINPGKHKVVVAGSTVAGEREFAIAEREQKTIAVKLRTVAASATPAGPSPSPSAAPAAPATGPDTGVSGLKVGGWIAVATGAIGLGMGVATAIMAANKESELNELCPNGSCPPEHHAERDAYYDLRTMFTAGFIAGGVVAAGGVVMLLLAPSSKPAPQKASIEPMLWPGGFGVRGKF